MSLSLINKIKFSSVTEYFSLFYLSFLFFMVFNGSTYAETTITIEENNIIGSVNRNILGNNIIGYMKSYKKGRQKLYFDTTGGGIWDPISKKFDPDYINLIKKTGVSVLRWPGGPWLDSLQWQNLIGPASKRPANTFGLPEFLALCREVGAKPVITLPTKTEQLPQIAGLIEYLNSPADAGNPNGGIEWAKVRADDGQLTPWNVIWFEFGNETFGSKYNTSPEEYIQNYNIVHAIISEIDGSIKLGAVMEDTDNTINSWNQTVLSKLGDKMGFAIIHPYFPTIKKRAAKYFSKETIALSAMAADEALIHRLKELNTLIADTTGRSDLQLAVTEYNGLFVQNEPIRYRFTLFNAIHNANYLRIMLKPESNIIFANHWHLVNSYWGMIRELKRNKKPLIKQANYYVYEIYNQFLSDKLIGMNIDSPYYTFNGAGKISARMGHKVEGTWKQYQGKLPEQWQLRMFSGIDQMQSNGVVSAVFEGGNTNYYHASKTFSVKPNTLYRISVKVKSSNIKGGKVGIAVEDIRGWKKTFNQPSNLQLKGTTDWHWLSTQIITLPDATKLRVLGRSLNNKDGVTGVVKFSELKVEENSYNPGRVQAIVGLASKSDNNKIINIILLNKSLDSTIETNIKIPRTYHVNQVITLTGPTPYATNFYSVKDESIKIRDAKYSIVTGTMKISLPAMSINAISFQTLESQ